MRTFFSGLVAVALLGCPDWAHEREQRCLALDASTDFCAGVGGGSEMTGGGTATGGGSGNGGWFDSLPVVSPNTLVRTAGPARSVPVRLWEVPNSGRLFAVDVRDGGFSIWRNGDNGNVGNLSSGSFQWCSSAVNESSTLLGNAYRDNANTYVSVDDFDGGQLTANVDLPIDTCAPALALQQRVDGGFAFIASWDNGSAISFQRVCQNCTRELFEFPTRVVRVDEGFTDTRQHVWFSAVSGVSPAVLLFEVTPDATQAVQYRLASSNLPTRIELSGSGLSLHAAWTDGTSLWLATLNPDGGVPAPQSWQFPMAISLVDLVENANGPVAVLTTAEGTLLMSPAGDGGLLLRRIQTPFLFKASVALLGNTLRIAGQCLRADGGPGDHTTGCVDAGNPVLEFFGADGGAW